jgi:hypothetical protein
MKWLTGVLLILLTTFTLASATSASLPASQNFVAPLSGDEEVPPRQTRGAGVAVFQLSTDGTQLSYRLIASNIENVVASHIHVAPPGVNGPIVVPLFNGPSAGGRTDGVLAQGTITAANLTGPLASQPLSALIAHMQAGNTYVNVHTNDGVAPTDTGRRLPGRRDPRTDQGARPELGLRGPSREREPSKQGSAYATAERSGIDSACLLKQVGL